MTRARHPLKSKSKRPQIDHSQHCHRQLQVSWSLLCLSISHYPHAIVWSHVSAADSVGVSLHRFVG
jgi:hypothetical protein